MKKTKWLFVLFTAVILLSGCKAEAEYGKNGHTLYKAPEDVWSTSLAGIKKNGVLFQNTEEVVVIGPDGAVVTGADPSFVDYSAHDECKGVFRTGRTITLSPYIMSKYEVTQQLYEAVMSGNLDDISATPSSFTSSPAAGETQDYRPVECVTWYDAVYFCNLLTEKTMTANDKVYNISGITVDSTYNCISSATVTADFTKKGYRLPTEAEWEFAARGGNTSTADWNYLFSGHDTEDGKTYSASLNAGLDAVGWYDYNSDSKTHAVGSKGQYSENALGIYDMSGNVFEWCYDWYASISQGIVTDPSGPSSELSRRIWRGGGCEDSASFCSVCYRGFNSPDFRYNELGFRVVRSAP